MTVSYWSILNFLISTRSGALRILGDGILHENLKHALLTNFVFSSYHINVTRRDGNVTRTHNHLVSKQKLSHLGEFSWLSVRLRTK